MSKSKDQFKANIGVEASAVEQAASLGANLPGAIGNTSELIGAVANVEATRVVVDDRIEYLAQRLGTTKSRLLARSKLLADDDISFKNGSKITKKVGGTGVQVATSVGGAAIGGAFGSIVPVVGTTIGAIAGGAIAGSYVGGPASQFLFPDDGPTNADIMCELCEKQDRRELKAEDILRAIGRKARPRDQEAIVKSVAKGNRNGFGLDRLILEPQVAPLLGDSYFTKADKTACEYIAKQCNDGKLEVAQLAMDIMHMRRRPPNPEVLQAMGLEQKGKDTQIAYDGSYKGGKVRQPLLPAGSGIGKGGKGNRGGGDFS